MFFSHTLTQCRTVHYKYPKSLQIQFHQTRQHRKKKLDQNPPPGRHPKVKVLRRSSVHFLSRSPPSYSPDASKANRATCVTRDSILSSHVCVCLITPTAGTRLKQFDRVFKQFISVQRRCDAATLQLPAERPSALLLELFFHFRTGRPS